MPSKVSAMDAKSNNLVHPNAKAPMPPTDAFKLILQYFNHDLVFSCISALERANKHLYNTINGINTMEDNIWIHVATSLWFSSLSQATAALELPQFDTNKSIKSQYIQLMTVAKAAGMFDEIFIHVEYVCQWCCY